MLPNRTIILKILKKKKLDKFKIREQKSITSKYESMIPEKKKKRKKMERKITVCYNEQRSLKSC